MVAAMGVGTRCSCCLVAVFIGVAAGRTAPSATGLDASADAPALRLRLTVADGLPAAAKQALVAEAESIWRDGRVRLVWLGGGPAPPAGRSLRALVTPRAVAAEAEGARWPVGELLRVDGTTAIAVASIAGAQRIVDESERFQLLDPYVTREQRLGIILGRALAHEIGHYLLQTNTHAPYGLMRARIDSREFADVHALSFRLDRAAKAHLAVHGRAIVEARGTRGFSYATAPDRPDVRPMEAGRTMAPM
jgi:hypothetical protein